MAPVKRIVLGSLLVLLAPLGPAWPLSSVLSADPSNYQTVVSGLQAGDTLNLAGGSYSGDLFVSGLNGSPGAWITIQGPTSGAPAVFLADASNNTINITNSSYVALKNITCDGQHLAGPFGISANGGTSNVTHDILIEGCTIQNYDGSQQTDGISTKTPTWNWVIRGNRILGPGTGIYLGNSDGSDPFVAGIIEGNLIENPIGYCMEVKFQNTRPSVAGMPTGDSVTIIRNNVFIKNDQPSPDGDRPNLLVGGFPTSGSGSNDLYEIYANFFYHNPRESLFQGSGRISMHDNIFVDVAGYAVLLRDQDLPLNLAYVFNNTIYAAGTGIYFGNAAAQGDAVVGNLVFSANPIGGPIAQSRDNMVDQPANASSYVNAPSTTLGSMDFYPLPGQCQGSVMDLSLFSGEDDYNVDFNGTSKGTFTYRGAYAGQGTNPGWMLSAAPKVGGPSSPPSPAPPPPPPPPPPGPPAPSGGSGTSRSHSRCGMGAAESTGSSGLVAGLIGMSLLLVPGMLPRGGRRGFGRRIFGRLAPTNPEETQGMRNLPQSPGRPAPDGRESVGPA